MISDYFFFTADIANLFTGCLICYQDDGLEVDGLWYGLHILHTLHRIISDCVWWWKTLSMLRSHVMHKIVKRELS